MRGRGRRRVVHTRRAVVVATGTYAVEQLALSERPDGTELVCTGELGADLARAGRIWTYVVARSWEAAVRRSLADIVAEAERRAKPVPPRVLARMTGLPVGW
ncbi:MAG: hypothetical protein KatS3mg012_0512 [Gaiellaceae bacterium]|nr:MAG: hypothetical protein KatS3mg012_0512 [Gaiellaceae bacterium]